MANEDAPVVKEFKEFGTRRILEMLEASEGGFVDKQQAYDQIVEEFKTQRGWPDELTRMERAVGGTLREVFINRLHWIPARLCGSGLTEPSTNRPFFALPGLDQDSGRLGSPGA